MDLIYLVLGIAIIGFVVWVLTVAWPQPPIFKTIIYGIAAIAIVVWVIHQLGSHIPNVLK